MRLYIKLIIVVLGFFNLELSMLYGQSLNTDSLELIVSKQRGIEKLKTLQNLANYYVDNAPEKAIIFAKEALTIAESLDSLYYNDLTYQLLGEAFFYQDDTANAGYYFRNLLELRIKEGDKLKIGNAYNNLGILARSSSQYDVALVYYNKALNLKSELKDSFSISSTLNNIGVVYEYQGKYKDAFKSYEAALEMAIKIGDIEGVATGHLNIGALYRMDGDYINALLRLNKCLDIVDTVDLGIIKEMAFEQKYLLYKSIGDHKQALHYHEKYYELLSNRITETGKKNIAELEIKYQSAKKQTKIELLNAQKESQQIIIFLMMFGVLATGVFMIVLIRQIRAKKLANQLLSLQNAEILQQKEEIEAQRDEIQEKSHIIEAQRDEVYAQRDMIAKQNQDMMDSIVYARRIQTALFPPTDILHFGFVDYFILNMPRDIVSGDFYWFFRKENRIFASVGDCTGHGVPGAFMSVLSITILNELAASDLGFMPNEMLGVLRSRIVQALHQSGKEKEARDGLEMALVMLDLNDNALYFAGSYNPLILVRNQEITELTADRISIGISNKMNESFSLQQFALQKGDIMYLFSDGYADQFGSESGRKYLIKNFKDLLVEISQLPMALQKSSLIDIHQKWRGNLHQIDDIMVLGLKV